MTAPGIDRTSGAPTLLGAAHYWHGRWHRSRHWRTVAIMSVAANAAAALALGYWLISP